MLFAFARGPHGSVILSRLERAAHGGAFASRFARLFAGRIGGVDGPTFPRLERLALLAAAKIGDGRGMEIDMAAQREMRRRVPFYRSSLSASISITMLAI